ncbi:M48 family metalloprotease [Kaarinaea lacus]
MNKVFASNLPDIGNSAELLMSPEDEKHIGTEFMRQVRQQLKLDEDISSNEYIQQLGNKLASQIDTRGQTFTFFIVSNPSINAFAGPGGYIGVHTGLITSAKSEGELASVLAHEIAHVVQRHLLRSMESSKNMSLATFGAIIAAMVLGGEVGEAVFASTLAGTAQSQLSYSRAHEQEADRVGIEMLTRAKYNPNDMPNFFETLQRQSRYSQTNIPELLLTHPVTSSRIADTRARAELLAKNSQENFDDEPSSSTTSASQFELIQARLEILSQKIGSVTERSTLLPAAQEKNGKRNHLEIYKVALNHFRKGEYDKARSQLKILLKDEPLRIAYLSAAAENEIADNRYSSAVELLKEPLLSYPNNLSLTLLSAQAMLLNNNPQSARILLQNLIRAGNYTPDAYKLLAKAEKQTGRDSQAYEAMGDYYYTLREFNPAIKHFEQALEKIGNDNFRELQLKARISQLKAELLKMRTSQQGQ